MQQKVVVSLDVWYKVREDGIEEDCGDGVGICAKRGYRKVFVLHGQTIHQQYD